MLKHLIAALTIALLWASPAAAQSNAHISKVKAGNSCEGCNLFQAELGYETLSELSLTNARLRQANLSLSSMHGVKFDKANLSVANLFGGEFTRSSFRSANLRDAVLVGGFFSQANFAGADLTGANLSGADLQQSLGLTQAQLNRACGDGSTRLRGTLTIPDCK